MHLTSALEFAYFVGVREWESPISLLTAKFHYARPGTETTDTFGLGLGSVLILIITEIYYKFHTALSVPSTGNPHDICAAYGEIADVILR